MWVKIVNGRILVKFDLYSFKKNHTKKFYNHLQVIRKILSKDYFLLNKKGSLALKVKYFL